MVTKNLFHFPLNVVFKDREGIETNPVTSLFLRASVLSTANVLIFFAAPFNVTFSFITHRDTINYTPEESNPLIIRIVSNSQRCFYPVDHPNKSTLPEEPIPIVISTCTRGLFACCQCKYRLGVTLHEGVDRFSRD